jgi:Flp pilus assembly protein TadD
MKDRFVGTPNVDALNELGNWFGENKDYNCAAQAFASSLQLDSKQKQFPVVAFMLGVNLYLMNDTREAIPVLRQAEQSGYNDIRIHLLLAQALDETQARAEAETEWRNALEIDPEHSFALDHLSSDLISDKNDRAVIELLDAPRIAPLRSIQQDANLGLAFARTGKSKDALRVLRDSVNTYPDSMQLVQQLADVLAREGNREEAETVIHVLQARQHANSDSH